MSWMMVFVTGKGAQVRKIPKNELGFICLSGLATGGSWLCYYKALQDGPASVVAPIDKLSILASPKAVAVRDGRHVTVDTAQLVRDDIVVFAAGNQIYADAVVAPTAATSTRRSSRANRMRSRKTPATSSCRAASSSAACAARS